MASNNQPGKNIITDGFVTHVIISDLNYKKNIKNDFL
jgi:hypothetical protein